MSDTDLIVLMGVGDLLRPPFRIRWYRKNYFHESMMVVRDVGLLRFVHLANTWIDGSFIKMFTAEGKNLSWDLNNPGSLDAVVDCVVKIDAHKLRVDTEYV